MKCRHCRHRYWLKWDEHPDDLHWNNDKDPNPPGLYSGIAGASALVGAATATMAYQTGGPIWSGISIALAVAIVASLAACMVAMRFHDAEGRSRCPQCQQPNRVRPWSV